MSKSSHTRAPYSFKKWVVLLLLCLAAALFHQPLSLGCVKVALAFFYPDFSYEHIEWQSGKLVLNHLEAEGIAVDRIEVNPHWSNFCFHPKISILHPCLEFSSRSTQRSLPLFLRSSFFAPEWEISQGVLKLGSHPAYLFELTPGMQREEIGTFFLSDREELQADPLFCASLLFKEKRLSVDFALHDGGLKRILPLVALFCPEKWEHWEEAQGEIAVEGHLEWDGIFELKRLDLEGSLRGLVLQSQELGASIACQECSGVFSYPAAEQGAFFWDKLASSLNVKEMECAFSSFPLQFKHFNGEVQLDPLHEPQMALEGMLCHEEKTFDLHLVGKGSLQEDHRFWSVIECQCDAGEGQVMQALLSLCRHDQSQDVLQLKIEQAGKEHLELSRLLFQLPGSVVAGEGEASFTWLFKDGACAQRSLDECRLQNVHLWVEEKNAHFAAEEVELSLAFSHSSQQLPEALHCKLLNCGVSLSNLEIKEISGELKIDASECLEMGVTGAVSSLEESYPLQLFAKKAAGAAACQLSGSFCEESFEGELAFDCLRLKSAHLQMPSLTGESASIIAHLFSKEMHLSGAYSLAAHYSPTVFEWHIGGKELLLQHPKLEVHLPLLEESEAFFSYSFDTKKLSAAIDLKNSGVYFPKMQLGLTSVQTQLTLQEGKWSARDFYTECEGVRMRGDFGWDEGCSKLSLSAYQMAGSIEHLLSVMRRFPPFSSFDLPLRGSFSSEKGFSLEASLGLIPRLTWRFDAVFDQIELPLSSGAALVDGYCEMQLDSESRSCVLKNAEAVWKLQDAKRLRAHLKDFSYEWGEKPHSCFSLSLLDAEEEVAGLQVRVEKKGERWELECVTEKAHILKAPLHTAQLSFDERFRLRSFEVQALLDASRFKEYGEFLEGFGVLSSFPSLPEVALSGALNASLKSEEIDQGFSYLFESDSLLLDNQPLGPFRLQGTAEGPTWKVNELSLSDLSAKATVISRPEELICSEFEIIYRTLKTKGRADFFATDAGMRCEKIALEGEVGSVPFSFSAEAGEWKNGEIAIQRLHASLPSKDLSFLQLPSIFSHVKCAASFEAFGNLTFGSKGYKFLGNLQPGEYSFYEHPFAIEQMQLRIENGQLLLKAKTRVQAAPLWASLQLDFSREPLGVIRLFDQPEKQGLNLFFSTKQGAINWESAQGSCYGVTCDLRAEGSLLKGEVKVDGTPLSTLFPKELKEGLKSLQIGSGYSWKGDLALHTEEGLGYRVKGRLFGEEFALLGKRFQHLEADMEATPSRIHLSNVRIEDGAGAMSMKRVELNRQEKWELYIPQFLVREWTPSKLRREDGSLPTLKPFTIRNSLLKEVRATIGNLSSLAASGTLVFTNQFKREYSFLDIPLEALKDLGLDPSILTPIRGELDLELRGDKFYLVALKNAVSEEGRTEFYLDTSRELSYIDLEGRMHVNLRLRQDVLLKIVEPFTITVRGSLDKPRYGVQF